MDTTAIERIIGFIKKRKSFKFRDIKKLENKAFLNEYSRGKFCLISNSSQFPQGDKEFTWSPTEGVEFCLWDEGWHCTIDLLLERRDRIYLLNTFVYDMLYAEILKLPPYE